jgi:hypothetical protein
MREQHAQVAVAPFGNVAKGPGAARRVFLRRQAKLAGEVARIVEMLHIAS